MTLMYLGIYTLLLVIIWGFFIVAKIHAYKFKNFSANIPKVTKVLLVVLVFLSVLGYIVLIFLGEKSSTIEFKGNNFDFNEVDY